MVSGTLGIEKRGRVYGPQNDRLTYEGGGIEGAARVRRNRRLAGCGTILSTCPKSSYRVAVLIFFW